MSVRPQPATGGTHRITLIGPFTGRGRALDGVALVRIYLPLVSTYQTSGLSALGDPTRRAIFELINERSRPVGELARALPVSRPAVSQHLRVLSDAGLISGRPDGNRRVYEIDPDGIAAMRAYLDQFWTEALTSFKFAADNQPEEAS